MNYQNDMNENRSSGILVVDDEPMVADFVRVALIELTDDIEIASSGKEAVAACERRAFDLVISDIAMPEMDGIALLHLLAHDYPSMRRVILTGHADVEKTMAAINMGRVHRYLTKPCNIVPLREAVAEELEQSRKERLEINRLRSVIKNLSD